MDGRSIDYSKMEEQFGDKKVIPFSFSTDPESVQIEQVPCYLTYTNEQTHGQSYNFPILAQYDTWQAVHLQQTFTSSG